MGLDSKGFNHFTLCPLVKNIRKREAFMSMLLSQEEIQALTEYTKPALQRRQLQKMGIPFEPGRTGRPKVLREAVVGRLGGAGQKRNAAVNSEALSKM